MKKIDIVLPKSWQGLPILLSKVTTTKDNNHFKNNDTIIIAKFPDNDRIEQYLEDGDYVELASTNDKFEGHIFLYQKEVTQNRIIHHFLPTSNFLNRQEVSVDNLSEIKIISKILLVFHELSTGINFQQFKE